MFVSTTDVLNFVKENDVKFIRLSFCDLRGNMKNIAIMAEELPFAIENGIPFDAVCFEKSNDERYLLVPDLSTMSVLPWRPKTGSVIRFFCNIYKSDGSFYEADLRKKLKDCVDEIKQTGLKCEIGTKCEFYLFKNNEYGRPEKTPVDNGDIGKLYNQVKQLYNMHQSKELDKRINSLLSGLEKILNELITIFPVFT